MIGRLARWSRIALPVLPLGGCFGAQSVLAPIGPEAARIWQLGLLMLVGAALILLIVCAATWIAIRGSDRARRRLASDRTIVAGGIAFPVVTLTALLAYGVWVMRANLAPAATAPQLRIEVVGESWWWRIAYRDRRGARIADANEIRIPVGREIEFVLTTADVIHSFWVPSLGGKLDMIPGRQNSLRLRADQPGVYRGQCAEYCGGAHARMSLEVRAMPAAEFDAWLEAASGPAREPADETARRGRELFLAAGCGSCHAVRGTPAEGAIGPDLTIVGARRFIGAATLPTTPAHLAQFITDSQHLKPGNRMPPFRVFTPDELDAVALYLAGLK
jgi:cytochrome c oxidase subunit 2